MLLKVGRHLRPKAHYKLIVGREAGENNYLSGYRHDFITISPISHNGPLTLIDGVPTADDIREAAAIAARFSQGREADLVELEVCQPGKPAERLKVRPFSTSEVLQEWYV